MSSIVKMAVKLFKRFLALFTPKPKVSFGISSDDKVKLTELPTEQITLGSYHQLEKYDHCFEVISVNRRKQTVTVTDIEGKELTMPLNVFHYFFYEIAKFIPKTYVPINSKE